MIALGATIALLLTAELPRDPCAELNATKAALADAAKEGGGALEVATAQVQSLVGIPLVNPGDEAITGAARAELIGNRLESLCAYRRKQEIAARATSGPSITEILNRPEFAHARDRRKNALESLMRAILDWFNSLLQSPAAQKFGAFSRFVRALILTVAALLVLLVVLRLRALRRRTNSTVLAGTESAPLVLEEPGSHLRHAREALGSDPREAIRQGLLALLSALEKRRWARPDRVKTNRELASELPRRGAPADVTRRVEELVRWYDRTFYSLEPVQAEEARRFVDEVAQFEGQLGTGGAP